MKWVVKFFIYVAYFVRHMKTRVQGWSIYASGTIGLALYIGKGLSISDQIIWTDSLWCCLQ